jgi:hypothetical protein
VYEWFDPYGVKPDGEKKWISKETLEKLHEEQPYLTQLLKREQDQGAKILYNPYHWQADREGVNDCGWWVLLRLVLKDKSLKEIDTMIKKSGMVSDDWVTDITDDIINK